MKRIYYLLSIAASLAAASWSLSSCTEGEETSVTMRITSPAGGAVTVAAGDSVNVKVTISPDDIYRQLEFSSSDPEIFWANPHTGRIYGVKAGSGTLTVRGVNDPLLSATCNVTVTDGDGVKVEKVMIKAAASNFLVYAPDDLDIGQYVSVLPEYASNKALRYTLAAGEGLVSIDENTGVLTGIGDGRVTVRVEATDGSGVFATVSGSVSTVRPREYTPFDRSAWTIETSHPTQEGDAVSGGWQQLIDDPDLRLCMGLGKPGRVAGINNPVFFIIDMKETKQFGYFEIRHRDDMNVPHLAVWSADIEVSTNGVDFTRVLSDVDLRPTAYTYPNTVVKIELPAVQTGRYFKFIYKTWQTNSGNYMQTNDFKIGTFVIL